MTDDPIRAPLNAIKNAIEHGSRFAVATHVRPDGDAIGALLATATLLRRLGKEVDAYCQDPPPPGHDFIEGTREIRHRWENGASYDVAILVDCGEFQRVGTALADPIREIPTIINIDHHVADKPFGTVPWVDPSASSTCEMLYQLIRHLKIPLDPLLATQLYLGILTDTGSFRFSNTTKNVLAVATDLVSHGADPAFIARQVYDSASPHRLFLLARMLATVRYHGDYRIATAELTRQMFRETETTRVDAEGFINHLRSVKTVLMAVIFREDSPSEVHVSLRSKDPVDVARFARRYGGGGHRHAAAFRTNGNLGEVRERITKEALRYLVENE